MKQLIQVALIVTYSISCSVLFGQKIADKDELIVPLDRQYSQEEIDSLMPMVRDYFYEGSYEKVIEIAPTLLRNTVDANFYKKEYVLRSILGNSFIHLDDFDNAFSLLSDGLERAKKADHTISKIIANIDLGNIFMFHESEKALPYLQNALKLCKELDTNKEFSFITNNNLAESYVSLGRLEEAQFHLNEGRLLLELESLKKWKKHFSPAILHTQGAIYLKDKKYNLAIANITASLESGKEELDENYLVKNYQNLMSAYENAGQYKNVNTIRHKYDSLVKKRNEADKVKQQKFAASKFKLDRYKQELRASQLESELAKQKAEKNSTLLSVFSIAGIILLLLLSALLYSRHKRNKLLIDLKTKNQQYLQAKEKSEKLTRSNTKFLSTISHELRTPLYGIIGLSSVFLGDPALKTHKDDLKALKFSADYLLALVNDVLNLNRFSSKEGQKINSVPFNLKNLVRHIGQSFEFINKKNNNIFQILLDQEIPEVLIGDKTKLSQVLMNLVSNASKFTEDGEITVEALFKGNTNNKTTILFNIIDTGKGIPEDEQGNIFKEFTQVESYTPEQGTGLGLPIVNKILKVLNSKLHLVSTPMLGSTFSFEITLDEGATSDLQINSGIPISYDKLKNKHILVVDNNKINQVVTQKVLDQYEIKHDIAFDGKEAVAIVRENKYDAILMDINMPVMNGIEASIAIREFNTSIPILALTATNYGEQNNTLSDSGINDSIIKPYQVEDLLNKLIAHIC